MKGNAEKVRGDESVVGLLSREVEKRQQQYGKNELVPKVKKSFLTKLLSVLKEPMFALLIATAIIYFMLGEPLDGLVMLVFVLFMIMINVIQTWKTDKTLSALESLSTPQVAVIRDGKEQLVDSTELVPDDIVLLSEGLSVPADGVILECSDFRVNESSLTGESESVWKIPAGSKKSEHSEAEDHWRMDYCYAGTLVTQGSATIKIDKIGGETEYGKIGARVATAPEESTFLQKQVGRLVKTCGVVAIFSLIAVGVFTWFNLDNLAFADRLVGSILAGITLAMTMIPEEFPVILTVFLSMGAWRLAKKHSLIRHLPKVETLGAVSVLCVDKTGTITQNKMAVEEIWTMNENTKSDGDVSPKKLELITTMGLGCESNAYDPMEKAMLKYCERHGIARKSLFSGELLTEYSFTDKLKMMGHVWRRDGEITIAAKGSPENILTICQVSEKEHSQIKRQIQVMASEGLRVIAIARGNLKSTQTVPKSISDCRLDFVGLVGLSDPPRENIKSDIATCVGAGVRVVMITGDNSITAGAIAKKVGIAEDGKAITGAELRKMSESELRKAVKETAVFARVVPEDKMRIVEALKKNGEVVAMLGDGVNDAPALKYAHIGIAMGKQGNQVSREAADLILTDDNFSTIIEAIHDGRRIYDNIKKAIGYVITIHIPVLMASLLAPLMGIDPTALLFLPLHIVMLELIIDPTCSIVLERQPADRDIMHRGPRSVTEKLMSVDLLIKSAFQGLTILVASFGIYHIGLGSGMGGNNEISVARTMGLAVIVLANLGLVWVNSSEHEFALTSIRRLAKDKVMQIVHLGTFVLLALILYTPLSSYLKLAPLSAEQLLTVAGLAFVAVFWYEGVKVVRHFIKKIKL